MPRRTPSVPEIDMTSMMGLSAILIVLLLTASTPPYAAIESNLPGISDDPDPDNTVVPKVGITQSGAWVAVAGEPPRELGSIEAIEPALMAIRSAHDVDGRWEIIPDEDVPYDEIVRAIDVARLADFDAVTFGSGIEPTP